MQNRSGIDHGIGEFRAVNIAHYLKEFGLPAGSPRRANDLSSWSRSQRNTASAQDGLSGQPALRPFLV
jgi:hypothetical protein